MSCYKQELFLMIAPSNLLAEGSLQNISENNNKIRLYAAKHYRIYQPIISIWYFIFRAHYILQLSALIYSPSFIIPPKVRNMHYYQHPTYILPINSISTHHDAREVYRCECGKEFSAFGALSSHMYLKHDKRLTSHNNEASCKIQRVNNRTIFTYFLECSQNITGNQSNTEIRQQKIFVDKRYLNKNSFKIAIIRNYLDYLRGRTEVEGVPYYNVEKIMNNFINYFYCVMVLPPHIYGRQDRDFVEYFNEFTVFYQPLMKGRVSFDCQMVVRVLKKFYLWLKERSYTEMGLLCVCFNGPVASQ